LQLSLLHFWRSKSAGAVFQHALFQQELQLSLLHFWRSKSAGAVFQHAQFQQELQLSLLHFWRSKSAGAVFQHAQFNKELQLLKLRLILFRPSTLFEDQTCGKDLMSVMTAFSELNGSSKWNFAPCE
jgi:hypothetical protein